MVKLDPWDIARIEARKKRRDTGGRPIKQWSMPLPRSDDFSQRTYPGRPPLDHKAAFRPLSEIRLERRPYTIGHGPDGCGIYFLFRGFELLYIGKSVQLWARLRSHFMNRVDRRSEVIWFNLYATITIPELWLDDVEMHYIRKHQPPHNTRGIHEDEQYRRRMARAFSPANLVRRKIL